MAKENESKRERFVRLAENRTNKIIDMVNLLGNCANASVYEYSEADIEKIFSAIEASVREAKKRFSQSKATKAKKFTLQ